LNFNLAKTSEQNQSETDVSDRFLPLSDSYFKTLFHNLQFPAAIVQPDGEIFYANSAFLKSFDLAEKLVIKRNLLDYISSSTRNRLVQLFETEVLLRDARSTSILCDFIDGNHVPVDVRLSLKWVGEIGGILVIIEKENSSVNSTSNPKKKTEELENLFYIISHNLKSPIVSIQGFVKLLLEGSGEKFSPEERHFIERIQQNASRLNDMVQDVLQFSRLTQKTPHLELVSLSQVLNNIKVECFFRLKEKNISLKIARDLPQIEADSEDVTTVFHNLIDNAIKYIGETVDPEIEVGWEARPRFNAFWVSDNGPGVREKSRESLFKMFERAENTKKVEGAGVGLAIVKGIVEKYGGQVRFTSEFGRGTKVYFTLPT